MAKKKRRPRNRHPSNAPQEHANQQPAKADAATARRERKAQARAAREAARKREVRTAAVRRAGIFSMVVLGLIGVLWFIQRAPGPGKIPEAAAATASAAGCSSVTHPAGNPSGGHLDPGETITYNQRPATSGRHNPSPLPNSPSISTEPQDETMAVHFLEHAGVILYYRADGTDALPKNVVEALGQVATSQKMTLLMPYPDLPEGTALAMAAWNALQTCPGTVTADQATAIATGFSEAYACTRNAPEPNASDAC